MKVFFDERPLIIMPVGNGSYLYHYNIREEEVQMGESETHTQYSCDEVVVWELSSNAITKAVIESEYPTDIEQKLINDYNAVQFGVIDADEDGERAANIASNYQSFLEARERIKAQVERDCKARNIQ